MILAEGTRNTEEKTTHQKQYGKEAVEELIGEDRYAEIEREFKKEIALRLEPYWKDISPMSTAAFGSVGSLR